MVIGSLSISLYLVQLTLMLLGFEVPGGFGGQPPGGAAPNFAFKAGTFAGTIIALCWAGIVLTGGYKMKQLEGLSHAKTAAIMAMIPCNVCCLLGLPFGIWALVVLNRPEVRSAFK
jgi:hypothetical protein